MGKSETTIALEKRIEAIATKSQNLREKMKLLDEASTKVKSKKDDMDTLHIRGTKYNTMRDAETSKINGFSKRFKKKKDKVLEEARINLQELVLEQALLEAQLLISQTSDAFQELEKTVKN